MFKRKANKSEGSTTASPPRRKRRWLRRLLIAIVAFPITLVILVQILLWSDIPRSIAQSEVERLLGVKASIGAVHITWSGHTRVEHVVLTLPLEQQPFAEVDSIEVRHTALPFVPLGFDLDSARVEGVRAHLVENADGRWNVQSLLPGGSGGASGKTAGGILSVPDLDLHVVHLDVVRADGRKLESDRIRLIGRKVNLTDYHFELKWEPGLDMTGDIALTGAHEHRVTVNLSQLPPGVAEFIGAPVQTHASGQLLWTGRLLADGVDGLLSLQDMTLDTFVANGKARVRSSAAGVAISPDGLDVVTPYAPLQINTGQIRVGKLIEVDNVRGKSGDGTFGLNGSVDPATLAGNLDAVWAGITTSTLLVGGQAKLSTRRDLAGLIVADLSASFGATLHGKHLAGTLQANARGDSPESIRLTMSTTPLTVSDDQGKQLALVPALSAEFESAGRLLKIASLKPIDASMGDLHAAGGFDLDTLKWWATIDTTNFTLPELRSRGIPGPIAMDLDAYGTLKRVDLKQLYLASSATWFWSNGFYDADRPQPLELKTWAWYTPPAAQITGFGFGGLVSSTTVKGTLSPLKLDADGETVASGLLIGNRKIGDVSMKVVGFATPQRVHFHSEQIRLFDAQWQLEGDYFFGVGQPAQVNLQWQNLPAQRLADLAALPGVKGALTKGVINLRIPGPDLNAIEMDLTVAGTDLGFQSYDAGNLALTATLRKGDLVAKSTLTKDSGTITAEVSTKLGGDPSVHLSATLKDWQMPAFTGPQLADVKASLSGTIKGAYDLTDHTTELGANLTGDFKRGDSNIGDLAIRADVEPGLLNIDEFRISILGGDVKASGIVRFKEPEKSRLIASFDQLSPDQLSWLVPALADVSGRYSGQFSLVPATQPRPLGPMEISLTVNGQSAAYRTVPIDSLSMKAYASFTALDNFRFVTDHCDLHVADGVVNPFIRVTRAPGLPVTQLVTAHLTDLDLQALSGAMTQKQDKDIVGRLSGNVRLFGQTRILGELTGSAQLKLERSDLVHFTPVNAIFNLLHLGTAGTDPRGTGTVNLTFADGVVMIDSADYYNRGVSVSAYGPITEIENLAKAKPDLIVAGSALPLGKLKLPFVGDFNDFSKAFQEWGTAVKVTGTIDHLEIRQAAASELGDTFMEFMTGRIQNDNGGE